MALFTNTRAVIGLDIGTSSLKVVELLPRRKGVEVTTYAQAGLANPLIEPIATSAAEEQTIAHLAKVVTRLLDRARVSTEQVVAALPSSVVFSTVLSLPNIADADMDKAVQFAARDIVPANLEEMVLGWSRVGQLPHMAGELPVATDTSLAPTKTKPGVSLAQPDTPIPIFLTAAPKDIVRRYTRLIELLQLDLLALEVETFALARSLLAGPADSALIVDIGDLVTTFHLIDNGTVRVSHSVDLGGAVTTQAVAEALHVPLAEAEQAKIKLGLVAGDDKVMHQAVEQVVNQLLSAAHEIQSVYAETSGRRVEKTILIGGGANLRGLLDVWNKAVGHKVTIGNPWKGLAYPQELERRLQELGPTYAVAVGLAQRGAIHL